MKLFVLILTVFNLLYAEVTYSTPVVSSSLELTRLNNASNLDRNNVKSIHYKNILVPRVGIFYFQTAQVTPELSISFGLGGNTQYQYPEKNIESYKSSQTNYFYFGPVVYFYYQSKLNWLGNSPFEIQGGGFSYKQNPKAVNLGEYLFRTLAYPNVILNSKYSTINDNASGIEGFRLFNEWINTDQIKLKTNFFVNLETVLPVSHDISLAFIADFSLLNEVIQLGMGVNFKSLFLHDAETEANTFKNAYFKYGENGKYYSVSRDYPVLLDPLSDSQKVNLMQNDSMAWQVWKSDSIIATKVTEIQTALSRIYSSGKLDEHIPDSLNDVLTALTGNRFDVDGNVLDPLIQIESFSRQSIITSTWISFDFNKLLNLNPAIGDFSVFAEWAVLGLKDQPVFYDDITRRMPIMLGVNLPTFFFDIFSLQYEYYNSPHLNSYQLLAAEGVLTPFQDNASEGLSLSNVENKDNHRWSMYMKKSIDDNVNLYVQLAKDHLRLISFYEFSYGPGVRPEEALHENGDWYWSLKLEWGL